MYVRACVVQQVLGNAKITGTNNGMLNVCELDGEDAWFWNTAYEPAPDGQRFRPGRR